MARLRPTQRSMRALRCLRLILHFLWGAFLVATVYPLSRDAFRLWLKRNWSRQLLAILGVRLDSNLSGIEPGSLIVANHISWLDIYAINAVRPSAFVSKAEVRGWPLIGWLSSQTDTIFLRRDSRRHASAVNDEIAEMLAKNKDVVIFPEGTTTDGTKLLKFHSALLQSAIAAGRPVQPVALSYFDAAGQRSLAPVYAGETTMAQCLSAIFAHRRLVVRLRPTPALDANGQRRGDLARTAQGAIAYSLGVQPVHDSRESKGIPQETSDFAPPCAVKVSALRSEQT